MWSSFFLNSQHPSESLAPMCFWRVKGKRRTWRWNQNKDTRPGVSPQSQPPKSCTYRLFPWQDAGHTGKQKVDMQDRQEAKRHHVTEERPQVSVEKVSCDFSCLEANEKKVRHLKISEGLITFTSSNLQNLLTYVHKSTLYLLKLLLLIWVTITKHNMLIIHNVSACNVERFLI